MFFILATLSLLALHEVHSYVLLTANVDDVQNLAKQIADPAMTYKLANIWRRATDQFNQVLNEQDNKHQKSIERRRKDNLGEIDNNLDNNKSRLNADENLAEQVRRVVRLVKTALRN